MADVRKQTGGLNGAYYGPPIPPQRAEHRSIGRGGSCCCTPCSLLCSLFKFLLFLVVVAGALVLVLWLIFRPHELKSYAENATLTKFDLANDTISYNLAVDLSIRNPNRRVAFYYDRVQATASYDGTRFSYNNTLPTFFQDHKNTTTIHPSFVGQRKVVDGADSLATAYSTDKTDGYFDIDVRVDMKVRIKVWFVKTNKYSPKIKCSLKVPVPSSSGEFSRTQCDVDFF